MSTTLHFPTEVRAKLVPPGAPLTAEAVLAAVGAATATAGLDARLDRLEASRASAAPVAGELDELAHLYGPVPPAEDDLDDELAHLYGPQAL